jgi:hypothetical protein
MSDGVDNLKQSAYNKAEELKKHSTEESKNRAKSSNTDSSKRECRFLVCSRCECADVLRTA